MIDHSYAQTNRQLFSQMQQKGYSPAEVVKVCAAHELARTLVTGFYRPSGSPFISHLVGTASVLAGLRVPVELVIAGLLHAAYMHGDFGTLRRGATAKNREVVRQAVGAEVEEYVARYTALEWRRKTIDGLKDRMNSMNFVDRNVVLICLANWLEHLLDFDILCGPGVDRRLQAIMRRGPILVDAAHMLGYPSLGEELESIYQQTLNTKIVQAFRSGPGRTFLVVPLSYRKRLLPAAYQIAGKTTRRLRSAVRRRLKRARWDRGGAPDRERDARLHTGVD